ncbi:extensin family protein [Lysobacter panacisoli]|uniref:Extensin family protein n=1 Tax=Lysobacter panacisoli TaxID=1255263 RepID=A0ABP9LA26_9GAMM|nr:extensin family protein [Lysobacter panacisoli]
MPIPSPVRHLLWLLPLSLALAAVWAVRSGRIEIPEKWNPWAPLRIDAPPNFLTRYKLERDSEDRAACRVALSQASMRLVPLPDRITGEHCGFDNAVRIERSSVAVSEPFSLSCRAALSLAMWERHALQQAAQAHLGVRVRRIEHLGSYACRNLYSQQGGRRSQHATADALDIAAFVMEDGRRVSVLHDWRAASSGSSDEAAFLRAVHDGACGYFDVVLGPDYNRAHADHFHFDRGRARICR